MNKYKSLRFLKFILTGNRSPFQWFRQSRWRKFFLGVFFFLVVMVTLHFSFHIALDRVRLSEHEMDLATTYMARGEYDEAVDHYTLALENNRWKRQAWIGKGLALMYLKRYDESLANYEDLLKFDSDNVQALQGKGMSLGFMGKYDEAIASYDKALEIQPDFSFVEVQRERLKALQKQ